MRLFVSIALTPEMKKCIRRHMAALKREASYGRYPSEENFHITLTFIGEYNDPSKVRSALETVEFAPFEISAGGFGNFGSTYFVRVFSSDRVLDKLAEKVKSALDSAKVSFDRKDFKAHITIGRDVNVDQKGIPSFLINEVMTVTEFSLMRSDLIGGKRIYRELCKIRGKK